MSNKKCCVPGCINSSGESKDILHKLPNPAKEKERFNLWVYAVGGDILSLPNDHIYKYRRVCHRHFEEKYWCSGKHLSVIAIPTRHLAEHSEKFISDGVILPLIRTGAGTPAESTSKVLEEQSSQHGPAIFEDVKKIIYDPFQTRNVLAQQKVSQGHPHSQLVAPATVACIEDLRDCFETRNVPSQPKVSQGHPHSQLLAPATVACIEDLGDCFETRNVPSQPKVLLSLQVVAVSSLAVDSRREMGTAAVKKMYNALGMKAHRKRIRNFGRIGYI